ncbi:C-x8-C-x5-C-x3-H type zinc finger protein [Cryomyces antarcticus]
MVGMMNGDEGAGYVARLEAFRQSDAQRHAMVEEILQKYHDLRQMFEEKSNDYENEVASRRMWQAEATKSQRSLIVAQQSMESNSFVLALIDGDGAVFQDYLLRAAAEGGADAAHNLLTDIKQHIRDQLEFQSMPSIMVQIYANVDGLSRKLASVGIIKTPADLYLFARAFSLNQPLFSFIDVGSGKERADHKIKEMFRLFIHNNQCKHIIFGGCHDNGYLPNLDPYKRESAPQISLLETTPLERGFTALGFPKVSFTSVFRSDQLPDRPNMSTISPLQHSALPHRPATFGPIAPPSQQQGIASTASTQPKLVGPGTSTTSPPNSWAAVGKANATEKTINIAAAKFAPRKFILLNAYEERLDPELPRADKNAVNRLHERIKREKVCNDYHIRGTCEAGKYCDYAHGERLSPSEQLALRHKARARSCPSRSACRHFDCTFGHVCPYGEDCQFEQCYFRELHNIDENVAFKLYEDGSKEVNQSYLAKFANS